MRRGLMFGIALLAMLGYWSVSANSHGGGAGAPAVRAPGRAMAAPLHAGGYGTSDALSSMVTGIPGQRTDPISIIGFGLLGDSNSDEYRADDNRGGRYADTTLNWMEQLVLRRRMNFGPWGARSAPRRTGYAYNWARSGATANSLIRSGQHTGLAEQILSGEVSYVVLYIGVNDFHPLRGSYRDIYDGTLSDARLQAKIDNFAADITTAVDTIAPSGAVGVVIATVADPLLFPAFTAAYPDREGQQRATEAIGKVNARIEALAATTHGVVVFDQNRFTIDLVNRMERKRFLNVGGQRIDAFSRGDEPHNGLLGDTHAGTVFGGLLANGFLEVLNAEYGLAVPLLTDREILENAGLLHRLAE